jgi:hypothetical protein
MHTDIAKALLEAQKEFPAIKKDSDNPYFNSRYASLDSILSVVLPILHKHGLFVTQYPVDLDGRVGVQTQITHAESGQTIVSSFTLNLTKNDPQGAGSAITYARRYAIQAMLGLNIENDDDGNSASNTSGTKTRTVIRRARNLTRDELEQTDPLSNDD